MPLRVIRRPDTPILQIAGTVAGQRIRISAGTADERLAREKAVQIEADLYRGVVHGPKPTATWDDACLSYTDVVRPGVGQARLLLRLTDHFSGRRLADIDQAAMDRAVTALCRPGAAPATILRNIIAPVSAVLNHAARRGLCDPPRFEKPRGATGVKRTRWLTPEEAVALHDNAAPHLRPLVFFVLATGARLGEALALRWEDVNLQLARATLRDTKNGRDRVVDLVPAAVASLAAIPKIQKRRGEVFTTDSGDPYEPREDAGGQVRKAWGTACRRAGFAGEWHQDRNGSRWWTPEDVTPHTLRHTWATWHYCLHRDPRRLQVDGDWSGLDLVERYAKLAPASLEPAIRALWGLPVPNGMILTQSAS